jgi:FkbM family methyltransferase
MNNNGKQQLTLMNTMNEVVEFIKQNDMAEEYVYDRLKEALLSFGLNGKNRMIELLGTLQTDRSQLFEFICLFEKWFDANIIALSNRITTSESYKTGFLGCDRKFIELISIIKKNNVQTLIANAMDCLRKIKEENQSLYELLTVGYRGWYFETNWLDGVDGENNSLVKNRIITLKSNVNKIEWLYDHLEDNLSKNSLNALIISWLTFSMQEALKISTYSTQNGVANPDIFPFYKNEVFVDCGSYIGDTVAEFVNEFNRRYKKIYTYDISAPTVELMKENLRGLNNIVYNVKGVSDKQGELNLSGVNAPFHGNRLVEGDGINKVPIVKLDDDIQEAITFLKIDIEGLDKEAISGAKEHIAKYHPKMHIDTYHKLVDFFEVPLLIHRVDQTYHFYLRLTNSIEKPLMFATTCIYAL